MNTYNEWMKCPGLEGNRHVFMLTLSLDVSKMCNKGSHYQSIYELTVTHPAHDIL